MDSPSTKMKIHNLLDSTQESDSTESLKIHENPEVSKNPKSFSQKPFANDQSSEPFNSSSTDTQKPHHHLPSKPKTHGNTSSNLPNTMSGSAAPKNSSVIQGGFRNLMNQNSEGHKERRQNEPTLSREELQAFQQQQRHQNPYRNQNQNQKFNRQSHGPKPRVVLYKKDDPKIPHEYSTPPIWADDWQPYQAKLEQLKISNPEEYKKAKQVNTRPYPKEVLPPAARNRYQRNPHQMVGPPKPAQPSPFGLHNPSKPPKYVSNLPYSLSGVAQYDDITRRLSTWIYSILQHLDNSGELDNVEVELKFGSLKLPREMLACLGSEIIINKNGFGRDSPKFLASMPEELFKKMNEKVNEFRNESAQSRHSQKDGQDHKMNGESEQGKKPLFTKHMSDTIDVFCITNNNKLRISYAVSDDQATVQDTIADIKENRGEEIEQLVKVALDHKEIVTHHNLDFRVTVSTETHKGGAAGLDGEMGSFDMAEYLARKKGIQPPYMRKKNRTSYDVSDAMTIDSTVVQPINHNGQFGPLSREMEMELNKSLLIKSYYLAKNGDGEAYEELIGFWVNSARELIRKATANV